jgi:hypothetical protein
MRKSGLFYPLLLLVFWTSLLLAGDFVVLETSVKQTLASRYLPTKARFVESDVARGAIGHRGVHFEYNYTANGLDYTGHRYRYDDLNAAFQYSDATNAYPHWAEATVYYDPQHPEDSVMFPGLDGSDLLLLLFALPLNVVTLALWSTISQALRRTTAPPLAGGVCIFKQGGETRAQLAEFSPLAAGLFGLAAASFMCAFPVVAIGGFAPSLPLMLFVWAFVAAAAAGAFFWTRQRNRSGNYDLRILDAAQTVTLPQSGGRGQLLTIPRHEILGVSILLRVTRNPSGHHITYVPALECAASGSAPRPMKLVTWGWTESKARAFGLWLSQELRVQFKGPADEPVQIP